MRLKVYVACSSKEIERAERAIVELRAWKDVEVTHDWTVPMRKHGPDANVPEELLMTELRADMLAGVARADWLLYLASAEGGQGRFVELGGAFLSGLRIVIAGDASREPWARALGEHFYARDEDAIAALATRTIF